MFSIIKKYKRNLNNICKIREKGVSLISLIVTIIVLLILAAIAIRISSGNGGVIKKAKKGVAIYQNASVNESETMNDYARKLKTFVEVPKATSIKFTADIVGWTTKDVTVTATSDDPDYEIELKTEDSDWSVRKDNKITVSKNQQINARLKNLVDKYSEDVATYNVTNIDKDAPDKTAPELKATTNSITVTFKQKDDGSGIAKREYSIDSGATWKVGDSVFTFSGLTQGKKYAIITRATDRVGNQSISDVSYITTATIPAPVVGSNLTFTPSTSNWTNSNVSVAVSTTVKGYTLQTSTDGKTWGTTNPLTYSANGTAYARLWDGNNASAVATTNITNIDKLAPTNTAPTVATTTNKITATLKQVDQNAANGSGKSDLNASKTQYRLVTDTNGTTAVTGKDWQSSNVFSGLTQNTTYYVQTKVTDNAVNTTTSAVATAKTGTIPILVPETPVGTKVGTTIVDGKTLDWYLFDTDETAGKAYLVSTPTLWVPDTTKEVNGAWVPKLISGSMPDLSTGAMHQAIRKKASATSGSFYSGSYDSSKVTYTPSESSLNYYKSVNSQWSAKRGSTPFASLNENEQEACYLADEDIFAGIKDQVNKADGNLKGKIQTLVGGASVEQWCKAYNNQAEVKNDTTKQITCEYSTTDAPGYDFNVKGASKIYGDYIYGAAYTNEHSFDSTNPFSYFWLLASPCSYDNTTGGVFHVDGGLSGLNTSGDSYWGYCPLSLFASMSLNKNLTFTATPTTKTSGNVTVKVSTTVTGYTLQTSTDGKTWGTTNPLIFSQNGTAYARLWDGTNASAVATFNITNIETDPLKNTDRTIDDLNADGGDSNKDGVVDTKDDLRGFYIDLNNDGNLDTTNDGVIYGDLLTGGKGVYWCHTTEGMYDDIDSYLASLTDKTDDEKKTMKEEYNSATGTDKIELSFQYRIKSGIAEMEKYTIPTKSTLSTYEIIKDSNGNIKKFDGPFGSRGMLQRKTTVTNGDRFYVLALADFDSNTSNTHSWYFKATNMTDYATYTSTSFGSGKENTSKMITAWNNKKYGEQNGNRAYPDVWGVIQDKAKAGWFVPSRDEWNAFGAFFKVGGEYSKYGSDGNEHTFTDYNDYNKVYKLSSWCWSSSQGSTNRAFDVWFIIGFSSYGEVVDGDYIHRVRLGSTF